MNYFLYSFTCVPVEPTAEILISMLAEIEFESFVLNDDGVEAYIAADCESEKEVIQLIESLEGKIDYRRKEIKDQNWNAQWEKSYEPVCVRNKIRVRAPFHEPDLDFENDILIQPKMSFGTGHHETTWLMLDALSKLPLAKKSVLDAGSGTGVLAIAASKLGADQIMAYDIEEWAFKNTVENVALNHARIDIHQGDVSVVGESHFGVILANINKNVLLQDMSTFAQSLMPGAHLILSGFFRTDVEEILDAAIERGLTKHEVKFRNDWAMLHLLKPDLK